MMEKFSLYKGLQLPLIYRGFKGKFIAWGIASLIIGLLAGGICGALINMYLGCLVMVVTIAAGLLHTFHSQKGGLHNKPRSPGIFIHQAYLNLRYEAKKNSI